MKKIISLCVIAAMLAAVLCACGASKEADGYAEDIKMQSVVETTQAASGAMGITGDFTSNENGAFYEEYYDTEDSFTVSEASGAVNPAALAASRKLIRNASLEVQTKGFDTFLAQLEANADKIGGYVERSEVRGDNYNYVSDRYAYLVLRIPSTDFDAFISGVSEIATVTSKEIGLQDVTSSYVDTESRIKALETEQESLLSLLKKAINVSEVIEIQDRLTQVRGELESYKGQLKLYDEQIAYSTITVNVYEVERVTLPEQEGFLDEVKERLSDNLYDIGEGFRELAVWFISSLPYLAMFAVAVVAFVLIVRAAVKKRRKKRNINTGADTQVK